MIAVIGLEVIGDDARDRKRRRAMSGTSDKLAFRRAMTSGRFGEMMRDAIRQENAPVGWVARITGRDAKYGLAREFLRGSVSFRDVKDEIGARGVFRWYELAEGAIFEVNAPLSWTSADRYFCRSERGRVVRMTREEIDAALPAALVEIATVVL
jgi:hypothetical protein